MLYMLAVLSSIFRFWHCILHFYSGNYNSLLAVLNFLPNLVMCKYWHYMGVTQSTIKVGKAKIIRKHYQNNSGIP